MSVPAAYMTVVLLWATTPLAIVWSVESMHPTLALLLRMGVACVIGWMLLLLFRMKFPWCNKSRRIYVLSAFGITAGMSLSYVAAQYISSGLMSLVFGLSPIASAFFSRKLLDEKRLLPSQKLAMLLALIGLSIVCYEKINLNAESWKGIGLVFISVLTFSMSGVLMKRVAMPLNPVVSTVGALTFSMPVFLLIWLVFDGNVNIDQWTEKSVIAIVYSAIFGSIVGFVAYFYILNKLPMTTVALATIITPPLAIFIGSQLNDESVSIIFFVGTLVILAGLSFFQFGERLLKQIRYFHQCQKLRKLRP
ncbi:MAG: DMT family transporter [Pseudomonadota bacterium]